MKTRILVTLAVLALAGFVVNALPVYAGANVNVNVGIPVGVAIAPAPVVVAPQPVYVEQPPEMVVIPRSNVYFAPGVSVDLFFYDNEQRKMQLPNGATIINIGGSLRGWSREVTT